MSSHRVQGMIIVYGHNTGLKFDWPNVRGIVT